ncbi:protein SRC2 homolog [Cornus florida]|uniref:protein SRC2 homolog n=1 Tax=Cornus florida TaxID=4283 RepID=UPI00289B4508|nr:protein SRC2 homolog [Cornus florida]
MGCCSKPKTKWVCTDFKITLISATDLKGRKFSTTKVYAGVSICGGAEKQTPVDTENGTNPTLNFNAIWPIDDSDVQHYCSRVVIKLYWKRRFFGDRCIGQVDVPLKDLRDRAPKPYVEYHVSRGSKVKQGTLKFSYDFGVIRDTDEKPSYSLIKRAFDGVIAIVSVITCSAALDG